MMNKKMTCLKIVAAAGLAVTLSSVAQAQPFLINGSGASLLASFFKAPASTNDFIDVNTNGLLAIDGDQLAPTVNGSEYWQQTYRIVGSGSGFAEMRDWGVSYATGVDGDPLNLTLDCTFSEESLWNRTVFCSAGVPTGPYNSFNPGGSPTRSLMDGSYLVTSSTDPAISGVSIDFSSLDVPVSWFTTNPSGSASFSLVPGAPGYGTNSRQATDKTGTALSQGNQLKSLSSPNGHTLNTSTTTPDSLTVFDSPITLTTIAAIVNFGVGIQQIKMSDLRHLSTTGRRINGENLMAVTRDSGSGTRNAFMNGICLDPSWGVGENIGSRTVFSTNDRAGPDYQPSNKGGSSRMESTCKNTRLAIGHTGAERGISKGWLNGSQLEVLAVQADLKGGTVYARPTLDNVLSGSADAYNIIGNEVIATIGDPRSAPANLGGWGWDIAETGPNIDPVQPMRNPQAAAYVNNITRSIDAFVSVPGAVNTLFTPGEFLATQFLLVAAANFVNDTSPNPNDPCINIIPNPSFNQSLQDFIRNQSGNVLGRVEYQNFNTNSAGLVPTRTTSVAYSDSTAPGGSPTGQFYVNQAGTQVSYAGALALRNKIAGDFDGDGARTPTDVPQMLAALAQRNGGPVWNAPAGIYGAGAGQSAIIEVLGDFNCDGNFNSEDVRYWADGLHMVNNQLDRNAGYTAVDNAFGGNFFNTTIAGVGTYANGDSRADIVGANGLTTRGFTPTADGVIDQNDVDYVIAQFTNNPFVTDGQANWNNTAEAAGFDLSADITGDLIVDQNDVDVILAIINGPCLVDLNHDGNVDVLDFFSFITLFNTGDAAADLNTDGNVDVLDFFTFISLFNAGCP